MVAQTRCTTPAATTATIRQNNISGINFEEKSSPNNNISTLDSDVKLNKNNHEPMKPPNIVFNWLELNHSE